MPIQKRLAAEFIGTLWLVLGGCGSAVLAAAYPGLGIGFVGVSLAFGLTVLTMAYAIGHVSGCHLNPAVSVGLWAGGRFPAGDLLPYLIAQVLGGVAGAGILYLIASGHPGFDLAGGFASNGYADHSPGGYSLVACLTTEVVMTFGFLFVIMGATHGSAPKGFAPIAIGLCLTSMAIRNVLKEDIKIKAFPGKCGKHLVMNEGQHGLAASGGSDERTPWFVLPENRRMNDRRVRFKRFRRGIRRCPNKRATSGTRSASITVKGSAMPPCQGSVEGHDAALSSPDDSERCLRLVVLRRAPRSGDQ